MHLKKKLKREQTEEKRCHLSQSNSLRRYTQVQQDACPQASFFSDASAINGSSTTIIVDGWYCIPMSNATSNNILEEHRANLLVQSTEKDWITGNLPPPVEVFWLTPHHLCMPRYYGIQAFGTKNCLNLVPRGTPLPLPVGNCVNFHCFVGELDEDCKQVSAYKCIIAAMKSSLHSSMQLCLPSGYGKMVTTIKILCSLQTRVMVVIHKKDMCNQWVARGAQYTPVLRFARLTSKTKLKDIQNINMAVFTIQAFMA